MDLTETSALEQWRQAMEQQTSPSDVPATPPGPTQFTADQQPDTAALTRRVGASMQGAAQPDSLDWKQWLGLGMEGFASGYAGRAPQGPGLLLRKQQQDQEAAQKQQLMQLEKINGLHKIVGKGGIMEGLQSLNLSEDQQKILVPQLRGFVKESTGVDFGDAYTQDLLSNKGAIEAFDAMMPEHGSLLDKTKLAIVKRINANPENAHKIVNDLHFQLGIKMAMEGKQVPDAVISQFDDKQKATIGDIAFKQILGTKNDASGNAKLKTSDLSSIPNADLMTDARINTLKDAGFTGLESKATMEAKAKADIESAATKAAGERQDKQIAAADERQNKAIAATDARFLENQRLQLQRVDQADQRIALQEQQQRRLLPSQQKQLTGDRTAMAMIDDYKQGYEKFAKESGGATLSDIFRGTIAKNKTAQKVDDLVSAKGRTPAEIELAAKYNALIGNLRNLTNEVGVLTDMDAIRILVSFDPAQDRKQVLANLDARRKSHERSYNTQLEDLQATGKDVSKFTRQGASGGAHQDGEKGADKNGKPYTWRGGKPIYD